MASAPENPVLFEHKPYTIYTENVGGGSFGQVHVGYDTDRNMKIAAKKIVDGSLELSQKEFDILRKLREHDNVVRVYDTFIEGGCRWIIMQLCKGRTLSKYMEQEDPQIGIKLELLEQLCEGMIYMHEQSVAHRDLKPDNIMIVRGHQLKICDFGLAKFVEQTKVGTKAGTLTYIAPELFTDPRYDPFKADTYSAGLITAAVATYKAGRALEHLFAAVFGVSIAQQMLQQKNPDLLREILCAVHSPCERTMRLTALAADMAAFHPDNRPRMKRVAVTLLNITDTPLRKDPDVRTRRPAATRDAGRKPPRAAAKQEDKCAAGIAKITVRKDPDVRTRRPTATRDAGRKPPRAAAKQEDECAAGVAKITVREDPDVRTRRPTATRDAGRKPPKAAAKQEDKPVARTKITGVPRGVPHIKQRLARVAVNASWSAGVSERGHTVLADDYGRHISLLHGPQCDTAARMELPRGVRADCHKAVDARGRVLVQAEEDADTICLDSKGREIDRSKSSGDLLTCIDDVIVYRECIAGTEDDYRIRLQRGGDGGATYLEPPRRWDLDLSVCRNSDGAYCVTEYSTPSLDFFTAAGDHIRHEHLPYEPSSLNGIAATSSGHVLIVEWDPAAIHIHDTSGRRVGRFTKQQMQVEEEDILGISYCREDETLTVLAGSWMHSGIRSVQTFRIGYK